MADFFIDPSAATNGSGSTSSPYNTWVGISLTANNRYFQRRGTTYVGAPVRPLSQVSAAGSPLTIGAYYYSDGRDEPSLPRPIVDHNGGSNGAGAVMVDACTNVVVRDIDGRNSLGSLGGGVTTRRSTKVTVIGCVGRDSEHGFVVQQDQASATSVCEDIAFIGCEAYNNVGAGLCLRWTGSTAIIKRLTVIHGKFHHNGTGKGIGANAASIPCGGIMCYSVDKTTLTSANQNADWTIVGNEVYQNNGYGIHMEAVVNETLVSRAALNDVWGNGFSGDVDSHSLWVGNSLGVVVEDNYVHDNFAKVGFSSGSGAGIFIDFNGASATGGADCIVRRNVVARQFRGSSLAATPSPGIAVLANQRTLVEANVIVDCRQGITVGPAGAGGTDSTLVRNNLIVRATEFGIANTTVTNTNVRNNVITGAAVGLFCSTTSTAGYAEGNNVLHNCTVPRANGTPGAPTSTPPDASDVTTDPMLLDLDMPWLGFAAGSPVASAGTPIQGARDRFARRYTNPPNIGPWAKL